MDLSDISATQEHSLNLVHRLTRQAEACAKNPAGYSQKLEKHRQAVKILSEVVKDTANDEAILLSLKVQLEMHEKELITLELLAKAQTLYDAEQNELTRQREQRERPEVEETKPIPLASSIKQPTGTNGQSRDDVQSQLSSLMSQLNVANGVIDELRKNEDGYKQEIAKLRHVANFLRQENERLRTALLTHRSYKDATDEAIVSSDEQLDESRSRNASQGESVRPTEPKHGSEMQVKTNPEEESDEPNFEDAEDDDLPPTQMHIANS